MDQCLIDREHEGFEYDRSYAGTPEDLPALSLACKREAMEYQKFTLRFEP